MQNIKTGTEFLNSFFCKLNERNDLDTRIVKILTELFETGKLSDKNIYNELDKLRKEVLVENKKSQS